MGIYPYPDNKSKCRTCGEFQYLHNNFNNNQLTSIYSCEKWLSLDNLEYLESLVGNNSNRQ
jgi:hypothetical protein